MRCEWVRQRLDEYLDYELDGAARRDVDVHLSGCETCAVVLAQRERLREALRQMPVPGPRPGFVDQALRRAAAVQASAVRRPTAREVPHKFGSWLSRRRDFWLGAALSGVAAALVVVALLLKNGTEDRQTLPGVTLALHETRDVGVMIDSERALENATITVRLTEGFDLAGFPGQQELRWQADLERGSNLLSLPVTARAVGDGELVAVVEHEGRSKRVTVRLSAAPIDRTGSTRETLRSTGGLS